VVAAAGSGRARVPPAPGRFAAPPASLPEALVFDTAATAETLRGLARDPVTLPLMVLGAIGWAALLRPREARPLALAAAAIAVGIGGRSLLGAPGAPAAAAPVLVLLVWPAASALARLLPLPGPARRAVAAWGVALALLPALVASTRVGASASRPDGTVVAGGWFASSLPVMAVLLFERPDVPRPADRGRVEASRRSSS
jgi:hypothetical protein